MSPYKIILCLLMPLSVFSQDLISEQDHSKHIQTLIGGKREVVVEGGRIDLLLEDYAFEIEWAAKWKESIGQALWYGLNTNRKPAIILLSQDLNDYKYLIRLNTSLEYAGLQDKVTVLYYPDDFEKLLEIK